MRKQPIHNGPKMGTHIFEPQVYSTRFLFLNSQQQVSHPL